tara:strand:+ start:1244 stop:1567 length:324 start_codon:yes stop_codon:yes gene_type:complete
MLNTKHFTLLAGDPKDWDQEILDGVHKHKQLVNIQIDQFNRGRESAELAKTPDGWFVKAASSLMPQTMISGPLSFQGAVTSGIEWANADPKNREFFARNKYMEGMPV